ncbi:unnamed protein product [Calypogeia fissa]
MWRTGDRSFCRNHLKLKQNEGLGIFLEQTARLSNFCQTDCYGGTTWRISGGKYKADIATSSHASRVFFPDFPSSRLIGLELCRNDEVFQFQSFWDDVQKTNLLSDLRSS